MFPDISAEFERGIDTGGRPWLPPNMLPLTLPDPPSQDSLLCAQTHLQQTLQETLDLAAQISDKERALAQQIHDTQAAIARLADQKKALDQEAARTRAYLSPVRRLPAELLREIFLWNFEEHAACAWVFSAVSSSWRRLAIRTPRLWSKVSRSPSLWHALQHCGCRSP
jgi:hypothetical protein